MNTVKIHLITCSTCKGSGKWECVATIVGDKGIQKAPPVIMDCYTCKGSGKVDPVEQAEKQKACDAFWCSCGNPSGDVTRLGDGEGDACAKHHYTCNDCGKVYQVG